jgi:hypothetical protein
LAEELGSEVEEMQVVGSSRYLGAYLVFEAAVLFNLLEVLQPLLFGAYSGSAGDAVLWSWPCELAAISAGQRACDGNKAWSGAALRLPYCWIGSFYRSALS